MKKRQESWQGIVWEKTNTWESPWTADEIELRRGYVRNMLRNVPGWKDLTDEQLDRVRIYRTGEDWYVEDADFYEYRF